MQITMLGNRGSGKTSYMAGLHRTLNVNSVGGFHIVPKSISDLVIPDYMEGWARSELVAGRFDQLSFDALHGFPSGTGKTTLFQFSLVRDDAKIIDFDWIDYRGALLSMSQDETLVGDEQNLKDLNKLFQHIRNSEAVMLFVDSHRLVKAPSISRAKEVTGINIFTRILREFANGPNGRELTYLIVLTKVDALEDSWKKTDYRLLMERTTEAFRHFRTVVLPGKAWTGAILPISAVGEGNAENSETVTTRADDFYTTEVKLQARMIKDPAPYNVPYGLFYCIGDRLDRANRKLLAQNTQTSQELKQALANYKKETVGGTIIKRIAGKPTAADRLAEAVAKSEKELDALRKYDQYLRVLFDEAKRKVTFIE